MRLRSAFRRGEAGVAIALLAIALYVIWSASAMPLGTLALPGPGFFPMALGLLLAGVAAAILVGFGVGTGRDEPVSFPGRKVFVTLAALAGLALAFEPIGAIATLAVFLAILFHFFGVGWWKAVSVAAIGAILTWGVFVRLLGVQLPAGVTGL